MVCFFVTILYSAACGHDIHFPSILRHCLKENPSSPIVASPPTAASNGRHNTYLHFEYHGF